MIKNLFGVERNLLQLLSNSDLNSMYIDYHKPYVQRIWFQYGEYRVYLHKIEPCKKSKEALYHPHPWESVIRLVQGKYEMGVGYSQTDDIPVTGCTLLLPTSSVYEMLEPDTWHYVSPLHGPVYSLMVTGKKNNRKMPVLPDKKFRQLTNSECLDIINVFNQYYNWRINEDRIAGIINSIDNKK